MSQWRERAETTAAFFHSGQEQFTALSPALWDPIGRASVAVSRPWVGERVLDACCGAGASAIPAAEAVGPSGEVMAVDLAGGLLERGRALAAPAGLSWLTFTHADVMTFGEPGSYDLVQCVLGVFLLPDMDAGTAHLLGLARSGGRVAVTTWAEGAIEPVRAAVGEVLPAERPELREALSTPPPADRVQTPASLAAWLTGFGLTGVSVTPAPLQVAIDAVAVRALFEGTALRGLLDGLDPSRREDLLGRITDAALRRGDTLGATTLVAVGTVP